MAYTDVHVLGMTEEQNSRTGPSLPGVVCMVAGVSSGPCKHLNNKTWWREERGQRAEYVSCVSKTYILALHTFPKRVTWASHGDALLESPICLIAEPSSLRRLAVSLQAVPTSPSPLILLWEKPISPSM